MWRVHLALQLAKRPELNERQARIILDAISLSSPEFFANIAGGKLKLMFLKMYFDISALPLKKRKTSFRTASPNDKSDLWRTHLALFLVKRTELNEWQKRLFGCLSLPMLEYFCKCSVATLLERKMPETLYSFQQQIVDASLKSAKIFATLGDGSESVKRGVTYARSVLLKSINYKPLSDSSPYNSGLTVHLVAEMELMRGALASVQRNLIGARCTVLAMALM